MSEAILSTEDILKILPHRYPFLMVDKVIELVEGEKIVAIKNVTANEAFFMGHFPEKPVMPGVMILEAMAQCGAILAKKTLGPESENILFYFVGAKDVRWKRTVYPGDTIRIEMTSDKCRRPLWSMKGSVYVGSALVASGYVSAAEGK